MYLCIRLPYIKEIERPNKIENSDKEIRKLKDIIALLSAEHDVTGDALREMRELTSDYTLPLDVCQSFEELYEHLQDVEDDLHTHIHLENTILFPRVVVLINSQLK
ncbi:MAG: hemerythrin domain-containing protein [Candidatus Gastranaerophilales bacterium]|nr:hemerythrin domain-containing protein [Candidatus Gastranaerophilales bacterium]